MPSARGRAQPDEARARICDDVRSEEGTILNKMYEVALKPSWPRWVSETQWCCRTCGLAAAKLLGMRMRPMKMERQKNSEGPCGTLPSSGCPNGSQAEAEVTSLRLGIPTALRLKNGGNLCYINSTCNLLFYG